MSTQKRSRRFVSAVNSLIGVVQLPSGCGADAVLDSSTRYLSGVRVDLFRVDRREAAMRGRNRRRDLGALTQSLLQ